VGKPAKSARGQILISPTVCMHCKPGEVMSAGSKLK